MARRSDNGMKPRNGLLILIGVCLFLLLLSSFSTSFNNGLRTGIDRILMPMQKGMNRLGSQIFGKLEDLGELSDVQEDNLLLQEELSQLRQENARLKLELQELDRLREISELKAQYPAYTTTAAHIIGQNSGNWYQSFLIDKGSDDGLAVNMNVLADGGLVGIITSVGAGYATVTTIINDDQYVSARTAESNGSFLVGGSLSLYESGKLQVENVGKDSGVAVGDMVMTSNISDLYVPGLLIGYVDELSLEANRLEMSGTLIPAADFDDLDTVLVVMTLKITGD